MAKLHAILVQMEKSDPVLRDTYEYKGLVDAEYFDVDSKSEIPDYTWHQVYVIGSLDGKVPLVIHRNPSQDNLPGGGIESGETIEEAARREIEEELNMEIIDWQSIGYQVCTRRSTGQVSNQFRIYATLRKIGEFINDPGGSVIGHKLVNLAEVNKCIDYGQIGDRMVERAERFF